MNYFEQHKLIIESGTSALKERKYFTCYPESPKQYPEDSDSKAKTFISAIMNHDFKELLQESSGKFIGEEISPFLQVGLGIKYPTFTISELISKAEHAAMSWSRIRPEVRTGILVQALENIKTRFFDIAYATMHTTGQAFLMSFQASGPHASDRALEAILEGFNALCSYPNEVEWVKPMGKFDLKVRKNFKAVHKGIGLVIGCSTFPIWNTVPGVFADLVTGNPVIIKPHPKAVLPIAIVVAEIQKVLKELNLDVNTVQLVVDSSDNPITKQLAEHASVKLIDYTGGNEFGNYIESLKGKTTFTEKAGVNSVMIDSVKDLNVVMQNIAFSVSLYSGQMCTAPQNIFIPEKGISTPEGIVSFEDALKLLTDSITGLVDNPKAGAPTLGAIQSEATMKRISETSAMQREGVRMMLASRSIKNEEFPDARIATPVVFEVDRKNDDIFNHEFFGPILFVVKTKNTNDSIEIIKNIVKEKGAITCGAYTTDEAVMKKIEDELNEVFTPVSFNFTGAAFINSHAGFSDLHVTGGNAAGNASFTNTEFIVKRFVWVGNRFV